MPVLTSSARRASLAVAAAAGLVLGGGQAAQAVVADTTITSGTHGTSVLPGPVTFAFTANPAAGSTFECSIDSGPYAACTSPQSFNLGYGTHFFGVRAVNGADVDATPALDYWVVRNVPCEQAGAAYKDAQSKFFIQQQKLVKAKKQLHRAHNHGTAAEFQQAKNKVRKIRAKIAHYQAAMDAASAQEAAVC